MPWTGSTVPWTRPLGSAHGLVWTGGLGIVRLELEGRIFSSEGVSPDLISSVDHRMDDRGWLGMNHGGCGDQSRAAWPGPRRNPRGRPLRWPERLVARLPGIYSVARSSEGQRRWVAGGGEDEHGGSRRGEMATMVRLPVHAEEEVLEGLRAHRGALVRVALPLGRGWRWW